VTTTPTLLERHSSYPIGFGGAAVSGEGGGYGFGDIQQQQAINLLLYAYEQGVTIFDTAPIYGFGESERRIGEAFANCRDQVFIVSKSGVSWHESKRINMTNDPLVATKMLEESRQRLNSDYIDLYMIHWPDTSVDIRRPMEVLAKAQANGVIRHIGLSNTNADDLTAAMEIAPIEVIQQEHNIFAPPTSETLTALVQKFNISVMGYGTYDKGILTGRVTKGRKFDASDLRSWAPWWKKSNPDQRVERATQLRSAIKKEQVDPIAFSLAYSQLIRGVHTSLCGTRTKEQIDSTLVALKELPTKATVESILCEYNKATR
jgi:myo-inositol catabolism protein IolS